MINILISLLVLALIFGLVWWIFASLVPLPEPFGRIAQAIIALIFVLLLVSILFGGFNLPKLVG
jgi:hypothetical protein